MSKTTSGLYLAATCIPVRERRGTIEALMVRRSPSLSFGGMWTFPGGILEDSDGPLPTEVDEESHAWGDPELLSTAARGAVRETVEETRLRCDISSLAWFSHWIPPRIGPPKRFATWFFIAPEHSGEVVLDTSENDDVRWVTPNDALRLYTDGDFPLAVPTWVTVDDLSGFASVADVADHTITQGPRIHHTRALRVHGTRILCWAGDAAYESGFADSPGPRNRVTADENFMVVERTYSA